MLRPTSSFIIFLRIMISYLIIMTIGRFVFLIFNPGYLADPGVTEFIQGLRFDMLPAGFAFLPVIFLLNSFLKINDRMLRIVRIYFIVVLSAFMLVNYIDVIYYKFTLKRTTWDIFRYVSTGDDVKSLIPQFLTDYWYMVVIWILTVVLIFFVSRYAIKMIHHQNRSIVKGIFYDAIMIGIVIVCMRGGFQLKPLNIIDASRYTTGQNAPLMLNTPFTLIKTIGKEQLILRRYFEDEGQALTYFNPEFKSISDTTKQGKNIVVIIMESLSKEYIGYYNDGNGYTPFLDSLMAHSTVFTNAYANGKRSIEALPAIFSGLPNLMNEAFNTSPYAGNQLESLAEILKFHGYSTSFFHGGKNGTMGFDSYLKSAGFEEYNGLDEYPDKNDFDGSWGIYDDPYFQYFAKKQNEMRRPFLTAIFSLSAHHPYQLPNEYEPLCGKGKLPIHRTICYSDFALKHYFNSIKNQDWYQNTVFLITTDHTAQSVVEKYGTAMGIYAIPMIIFDPGKPVNKIWKKATQQTDISPTILDYLSLESDAYFFGNSAIDSIHKGFAISYISGLYQYIDNEYCIHFDGDQVMAVYNYKKDPLLKNNLIEFKENNAGESIKKMKAIIQIYNRKMIENDLK